MGTDCRRAGGIGLFWLALLAAGADAATPSYAQSTPTLSRSTLPATGRQETTLNIPAFGRYAVTVNSPQGTALQLVDRLAGPREIQGSPGTTNGRIDAFLDRGEYKVVTYSHPKGSGEAKLTAHAFTTRDQAQPPLLVELKPVEGTLDDFEQVSYWLDVKERHQVILEAAGRNLADLRLWTNGEWLVDAAPATEVVQPEKGHPLLVCRLTADLNPGVYLLTAYGGVSQSWTEQSNEHPFYLRFGIPRLGQVGRQRHVMGPFGIDRWLVPSTATYFRLELPDARTASLQVGWFDRTKPFETNGSRATISKNSLVPVAALEVEGSRWRSLDHIATVAGAAGQPYVLQQFDLGRPAFYGGRYWELADAGTYWVSTVHSGDPADSVDATALITRVRRGQGDAPHVEPFASQVVELNTGSRWARRCNLLDTLTLFFHLGKAGKYQVVGRGTAARFRIEPFLISRPEHYEPPAFQDSGSSWNLDAGYFVLTAEPVKKGILDIAIVPADQSSGPDLFTGLLGKGRQVEMQSIRSAAQFPQLEIEHDALYTLFVNAQPEVNVGLVLRRYPVDLTDALPVVQQPGETLRLPITISEDSTLRAEAEDGALLDVAVDQGRAKQTQTISKGEHTVEVRYKGTARVNYTLSTEPVRLQTNTALPLLPDLARATPPKMPELTDQAPQFLDLDRGQSATFLVRADRPALYRLQSSGLLATKAALRTRTITSFDQASANGVGRNFFIEQYLREGDYQVTVTALAQSKGHLGLRLDRTPLTDGGMLSAAIPARLSVPAGGAVLYTFEIAEAGDYRLRSIGVGTTFRGRLEDAEGWPIEPPNRPADITRHFEPGTYRLVSLPEPVATRRVTLLERIPPPLKSDGHGPHQLPLAKEVQHVWMEPDPGAERTPDTWEFVVPAPIDASITLTGEMQGTLSRIDDAGGLVAVAALPPSRSWKGTLQSGHYRLDVTCVRPNNRAPYEVGVWPEQLVAGLDRSVTPPARISLSVGQDSLIQLGSFGSSDVRAQLFDAAGRLVARNDDAADDWNFQIQSRLPAGTYGLQVDPVGLAPAKMLVPRTLTRTSEEEETEPSHAATRSPASSTLVSMRRLEEVEQAALRMPAKAVVRLDANVLIYPLQLAESTAGVLVLTARSGEGVGLAVEIRAGGSSLWQTAATASGRSAQLEMPFDNSTGEYRLRMWSPGGRPTSVTLRAAAVMPRPATEQQLESGIDVMSVSGIDPLIGVAAVRIGRPGVFQLGRQATATRTCSVVGNACASPSNGLVATNGPTLWLVDDVPKSGGRKKLSARRVLLESGTQHAVQLELRDGRPLACDLQPHTGPVLAIATSMAGQPGIRLTDAQGAETITPSDTGMAIGMWSAAAALLGAPHPTALVWKAAGGAPIDVRLHQLSFAPPATEPAAWGMWEAAIAGITARAYELAAGPKRVHLTLGEATVGVFSDGEQVASLHGVGNEPFQEIVETTANRLTILHTRDGEDRFRVEMLPLRAADIAAPLSAGAPYEHAALGAGMIRLHVAASASDSERPFTVHVRGADADPAFIRSDGQISRGTDLPIGTGGTLLIRHAPGLLLVWIDRRGEEAADLWGGGQLPQETAVEPPAVVPLKGTVETLRFEPKQPLMLHLRTSMPLVTLVKRAAAAPEVEVHATATVLDTYVSEPTVLGLRALAGGILSGTAEITASPVTPITEGLGPETLLAAGDTHLFSFVVTQEGPVGVGVRATPDVVDCTLLDSAGKPLGSGTVQMPRLKAGTYLLALHAPTGSGPVQARPALAGVVLPGTSPPEEVIRAYMTPPSPVVTPETNEGTNE